MEAMVVVKLESSNRLQTKALPKLARISKPLILSLPTQTSKREADEEEEEILNLKPRVRMLVLTRMVRASKKLWTRTPSLQTREGEIEAEEEARLLRGRRTPTLGRTTRETKMASLILTSLSEMTSQRAEPRVANPTAEGSL